MHHGQDDGCRLSRNAEPCLKVPGRELLDEGAVVTSRKKGATMVNVKEVKLHRLLRVPVIEGHEVSFSRIALAPRVSSLVTLYSQRSNIIYASGD